LLGPTVRGVSRSFVQVNEALGTAVAMPPISPLALHARRVTGSVVGRQTELGAIGQELASAKAGRLTALTLEGEPGIGKTRLLLAAAELAAADGFTPVAVTADEEIRGPFLIARGIFASPAAFESDGNGAREPLQQVLDAISGRDDPTLEALSPDQKLLRVFDLAAVAMRALASHRPVALFVDDLQWADEDSVRLLRYVVRSGADLPVFLALATRPEELALVSEAVTLIADMERMGLVRRLRLERFTQLETAELLKQALGAKVHLASSATMHAQAEGVPFIVEELARTYRDTGLIQEIDGVWTLTRNADRLLPSAVRTLIQRRAARLPDDTKQNLADAAILGRSFSLKDLRAIKLHLGATEEGCTAAALAESLLPAARAGLLVEHPEESPADYSFTHDQIREFSSGQLTSARRRAIHSALVDLLTAGGEPPASSLSVLAHHALAAGDPSRAVRFSVAAAQAALQARAAEEVLRTVDQALPAASEPQDRVSLLVAQDEALDMLRRPADRLEGLAELAALADALGDSHLAFDVKLRRAAALRVSGEEDGAAELARSVRTLAAEEGDRRAELAACLELGQNLLRSPLGESFSAPAEVDLDGAEDAYLQACELARELDDVAALAAATRELGIVSVARAREWYVERWARGEVGSVIGRVAAGEKPHEILAELPLYPWIVEAIERYERAIELFEQLGDRRGVMSAVIARAYVNYGLDIHLLGAAKKIEALRRMGAQLASLTRASDRAVAELQMVYGVQVFARAKVVPDLALSRGEEAHRHARLLGDRSLEFATAAGLAGTYLELGEVDEAKAWLDRAAEAAAAAPSALRARQLELGRAQASADAGDAEGMREHLERAVALALEQERPAGRCETLAAAALTAASLGAAREDEELLAFAERSARDARELVRILPGHPPWGAEADAALAQIAFARGDGDTAAEAARSALASLRGAHVEDLFLRIVLPAARVLLAEGSAEERETVKSQLRMVAALIAQRIADEDVRVKWFRGPVGRELSSLTGWSPEERGAERAHEQAAVDGEPATGLDDEETALLWRLVEGLTNREIAAELGVDEEVVARRLVEMYVKIGVSSRGEAAAFAFRTGMV
jgi:DNA-binding CsgD family transcriptional regulator/tetratricopeptide (TPR) repeat protein